MLLFDGFDFQTRIIKLRPKQLDNCLICQKQSAILNDNKKNMKQKNEQEIEK
jgi:hypothetical protein